MIVVIIVVCDVLFFFFRLYKRVGVKAAMRLREGKL